MSNLEILKRLYRDYTKKFLGKIFLSVFFSVLVAGSTSSIAYLLDPAIEKIFIEKNQKLMLIIPLIILITFAVKGTSLYLARTLLIQVGGEVHRVGGRPRLCPGRRGVVGGVYHLIRHAKNTAV